MTSTIRIAVIVFTAVMVFGWATPGVQAADATLTYSKANQIYRAEPFGLTVSFWDSVSSANITITGGDVGSTVNDISPSVSLVPAAATPTAEWVFTRTVQGGDDGTFTVEIEADGAAKTVDDPTFEVDTTAPMATLAYDQADRLYRAETIFITATFHENATATPTITITDGGVGANVRTNAEFTSGTGATWTYTTNLVGGDEGIFTVTVSGADLAGNSVTDAAPGQNTFAIDTTPPAVSLTYNKSVGYCDGNTLQIKATFIETLSGAPRISIGVGNVGGGPVSGVLMSDAGDADPKTWRFETIIADSDPTGSRTVAIAITDPAGNQNTAAAPATFAIDNTHPAATVTYDPTPLVAGPVWIRAAFAETLAENPIVRVVRDGTGVSNISPTAMVLEGGPPNPRYKFQYYLFPQDGTRLRDSMTVTVASTDVAGNTFSKVDTCTSASTPKLQTTTDFKVELRPGLNLVSLPVKPAHLTARTLFLDSLKSAQMVARTTVDPITGESRFGVCLRQVPQTDFSLRPGYGYAVHVAAKATLVLTGAVAWLPDERMITLGNGPSLVGLPTLVATTSQGPVTFSSEVAKSTTLLSTLGTPFLATTADLSRTFEVALPVTPTLSLRPGKAYLTRLVAEQGGVVSPKSFMLPLPTYPGFAAQTPGLPTLDIAVQPQRTYPENKNVTLTATASGPSGATYQWTQTLGPAVTLNTPTALSTSFTSMRRADYAFTLTASVGQERTQAGTCVRFTNRPPVPGLTLAPGRVKVPTVLTLGGATSTDPDQDPITYGWKLYKGPSASGTPLAIKDPTSTTATYDVALHAEGIYTAELTLVDDAGSLVTATGSSTLQANRAPTGLTITADPAVVYRTGVTGPSKLTVTAVDPDSDGELRYQWELVTKPQGAQSGELSNAGARVASFAPSRPGVVSGANDYVIKVTVTDAQGLAASTTISERPKYLKAQAPAGNCNVYLSLVDGSEMVQPYAGAPFVIDRTEVSNVQYGQSGAADWVSRVAAGFSGGSQPVLVATFAEAAAYAAWAGKWIPSEVEWLAAAWGLPAASASDIPPRAYPWGNESPGPTPGFPDGPWRAHYMASPGHEVTAEVTGENGGGVQYSLGRTPGTLIWHLAGNAAEWTATTGGTGARLVRGGCHLDAGVQLQNAVHTRLWVTEPAANGKGFRCVLADPEAVVAP
ncbi:MAG: SUMF1/EgtB/PvdO family nonheme iron enzyme [Candidatus Riflebacteria bacterium]|nr:SUMF1/EgtB/PvdO family nonheme iron enzyme [Candidatus Riflebacteria bacterium]